MVLSTTRFHYLNNWVKVNNQICVIDNIIATCFWLVNQQSDLGHCLNSECQFTAILNFVDISKDGYYVALNAWNLQYLNINDDVMYEKLNNLRSLTINSKYRKMPILHHISANSHTCGSDAITFVESMSSLEVTLTVCHNVGLLRFSLPKIGGLYKISVPTCKNFQFWPFLSFDEIQVFFSFKHYFLLSDGFCSWFEVATTNNLNSISRNFFESSWVEITESFKKTSIKCFILF